ncbi:HAD family hydrolase [Dyella lutea]|uniref:HAD-IA family hydrolase n=1 Tax=Dyella lutea TaxID=2950441 RepID=A0ABT1FE50_9GAMM|nr:HAD-IA family hydrolase [Dyella lutea]MCP1375664.1 HAD-IA family hydrolase [Dyella lutea]
MTTTRHALASHRHWVFDLDGTLTIAVHDFAAIRRTLEIRDDEDILAHIAALPAPEADAKRAWLLEHEYALAKASRPADGAVPLVRTLAARGCRLGILTRNLRELALLSLEAIGLADCFAAADVLGREDAPPKPSPAGLQRIATGWSIDPAELTMVGDYAYDLASARAAGARSVLVNLPDNRWPDLADWHFADCLGLHAALA